MNPSALLESIDRPAFLSVDDDTHTLHACFYFKTGYNRSVNLLNSNLLQPGSRRQSVFRPCNIIINHQSLWGAESLIHTTVSKEAKG